MHLFPLIAGVSYAVSWHFDVLSFLQLVCLVPLFIAFESIRNAPLNWKKKGLKLMLLAVLFRAPIVAIDLVWLFDISMVALLVLIFTEIVLFTAVFSLVLNKNISNYAIICLFIFYELIMQNVTLLVPFYQMGYAWGNHIAFIQYYSFLGVEGGSALLILVNFALFKWYTNKKLKVFSAVSIVLFLGLSLYSVIQFYQSKNPEPDKNAKISIVHSQIESKNEVYRDQPIALIDSVAEVAAPNSLVLLPEVFFNAFGWVEGLNDNKIIQHIQELNKSKEQSYLAGAYIFSVNKTPSVQSRFIEEYNIHYDNNNISILMGERTKVKSKKRFIPFFEYIPDNAIAQWINNHITSIGDDRKVSVLNREDQFVYRGKQLNTLLCYESVFPMLVAAAAKDKDFLVIHTNEDWNKSQMLSDQYLKLNKANAIQVGIPVYRVSNYGYSAIINPNGSSKTVSNTGRSFTLLEGFLPLKSKTSFYSKIMGYSYWLSGLFFIYFMFSGLLLNKGKTASQNNKK
ncbi:apolipoprotein N-acyltransferase [Brumimicrobium sp.]|uniref:apolipoprotein N-acyltransferase n=1 Tax=Brumimicrobium sp. TaxID=2029867 RepID=UPI003A8D48E8